MDTTICLKLEYFIINDIIARDVNGTTELYVGVGASDYAVLILISQS